MNLLLTSDFPLTVTDAVLARIRDAGPTARVAWIAPFTGMGRARFPQAQGAFRALGVSGLEYCDIDEEPNERQLASLDQYDVVYLSGGDPLGFRGTFSGLGWARDCGSAFTLGV